jgi:hypothetical protein
MNKPLMTVPGLHSFAAEWRDDQTHKGKGRAHKNRTYELDGYFENWHSLITANQAKQILKAARSGHALNPDDLDHFSDDALHLNLLNELMQLDAVACYDEEMFMTVAEKCVLHASYRPNFRLAGRLYDWLRSLGYSTSEITRAAVIAVDDGETGDLIRKLEVSRLCTAVIA